MAAQLSNLKNILQAGLSSLKTSVDKNTADITALDAKVKANRDSININTQNR
jgi:hypothetical protein